MKCEDCKFCVQGESYRECRRYPPVFRSDYRTTFYPILPDDGWCAEIKQKPYQKTIRLRDRA